MRAVTKWDTKMKNVSQTEESNGSNINIETTNKNEKSDGMTVRNESIVVRETVMCQRSSVVTTEGYNQNVERYVTQQEIAVIAKVSQEIIFRNGEGQCMIQLLAKPTLT